MQVEALPAEIVVLCRGCAKLFQSDKADQSRAMELSAVHLVFFNHYLGPALPFPRENVAGFTPSLGQQQTLRALSYRIVGFTNHWLASNSMDDLDSSAESLRDPLSSELQQTATGRFRYEAVLERIAQSSGMASTYDPSKPKSDVDCELMGLCLMNIHSLLDSYLPEFTRQVRLTLTGTNIEQIQGNLSRMNRLLPAMSSPLTSIHDFVELARMELVNDRLLWNGWSFQEWQERVQVQTQQEQTMSTDQSGNEKVQWILPTEQVILEHDFQSPHEVDYLNPQGVR